MRSSADILVTTGRLNSKMRPAAGGPWLVHLFWHEIGGRLEVVGIEITSVRLDGPGESSDAERTATKLGGATLHSVPLALVAERHVTQLETDFERDRQAHLGTDLEEDWRALRLTATRLLEASRSSRGRSTLTPEHYAKVAAVYAEAMRSGRRDPVVAVAEAFGGVRPAGVRIGREISNYSAAAKWVRTARRKGLLNHI
jgi:hypothetical protein